MAEQQWRHNPVEPPEAIEKLIAELRRGSVDERHLEWDIDFMMAECTALFRAEVALQNRMRDTSIPEEIRKQREMFLNLAIHIVNSERSTLLDQLWELIGKFRGLTTPLPNSIQEALNSGDGTYRP